MKVSFFTIEEFKYHIKNRNSKIILFGAGAIGQIIAPQLLKQNNLWKWVDCYIDNDSSKWGKYVYVSSERVEIKSPDYLKQCDDNTLLIINISRYDEVLEQLETMALLGEKTVALMPQLLIDTFCSEESKGTPYKNLEPLIPKKIHYMWLGGKELPYNLRKCMETWEEYCPDYEIIRWDESNYDYKKNPYMKQAYDCGAFGFVPDFARLDILYNEGGFYLDTDVELIRSLDSMRYQEAFCGVEKWQILNFGGGSGAIKGHPMIKKFIDNRGKLSFIDNLGNQNRNTCGYYDTQVALSEGYVINGETQCINGLNIFAYDYFHPYDYMTGELTISDNTFSIHHFNGGWMDEHMKIQNKKTEERYQIQKDT